MDKQGSKSMSPLDLFIRDLDERKGKIPCCQEVTDIETSVEKILKSLLLEVEKEYPFLKTTLINSGSFYEGTKVGQPDEFDYFVQLDYFSEPGALLVDELPCSTVIVIPSPSGYAKLRKLRLVSWRPACFDWKICVKTPFVRTLNDKVKGFEAYGIKVLSSASKRHGPAYCLELEWTGGERYRGLKISVDLSLAVKINSPSSTMDVNLETPAGEVIKSCSLPYFFAVSAYDSWPNTPSSLFDRFKASDLGGSATERDVSLRCSQSCLEQALFLHFGSDGGPTVCVRVLKVLRDMLFPYIEVEEFVFNDVNSVTDRMFRKWIRTANYETGSFIHQYFGSKWISSYALKTLVLFEWEQNPADEQWTGSKLTKRLLSILKNLRLNLKHELCSFFYRDYKIFPSVICIEKEAIIGRITILLSLLLSIREATDEYNFEECLLNMLEDLKWICQKVKLYHFLLDAVLDRFSNELDKVVRSKSGLTKVTKQHFCSVYIQALLEKIAVQVKLILPEPETLPETVRAREAIELFKEIVSKRMEGFGKLPSFNFSLQAFEAHELAELLKFVCDMFKEDVDKLQNEL